MAGEGMVNFGTPLVVIFLRNWKCGTMLGLVRRSLRLTNMVGGVASTPLNCTPWYESPSRCSSMPSKPAMKSMCHQSRRNSPSVTEGRPRSSCSFTTSRMWRSSASFNFSREISFFRTCSRSSCNAAGRSRLPTWSARKGPGMLRSHFGAPALGVGGARLLGVGRRDDAGADLDLLVAFHRGLLRAAAFLAPQQLHFVAELDVRVDDGEREHRALVVAVAAEHVEADGLALVGQAVVRGRGVVGELQVDVLVRIALLEHRAPHLGHVVDVPGERHLAAVRLAGQFLQGFPADEVVVELDERAVAHFVRRNVVVLDVGRGEAAAD